MTDQMLAVTNTVILMGDTNINTLKDSGSILVQDFLNNFSLNQLVKSPTYHKGTPSLIDHFYTSKPRRFSSVINYDCGLSDFHDIVATSTKICVPKCPPKVKFYRSYKNFKEDLFLHDLQSVPFHIIDIFTDIDDSHWAFDMLVKDVIDSHAPLKKKIIKYPEAPFMNSALRKAMYAKRQSRNCALKDPRNPIKRERYRMLRNRFVALRKTSMQQYFKERCSNGPQSRKLWDTMKPFFSNKNHQSDCTALREGDHIVTNPSDIVNIFSDHFSKITEGIGLSEDHAGMSLRDILSSYDDHPSILKISGHHLGRSFGLHSVTSNDVSKVLREVNPNKATGHDSFPPKLLKIAAPALTTVIMNIVNRILLEKKFPIDFKKAEITPVFKSDNKHVKSNYRPISILPCLAIVTEKLINSQLVTLSNDIFNPYVSAYRKCHNTQCVVLKAVEDWKASLDKGNYVAAVSMDLSKAFDVLPHGLLLSKLKAYGCDYDTVTLFHNYLTSRNQRVKISNHKSVWSPIVKGVPQGSVLGPVLFNIFINDIFYFVKHCSIYNYADDNVISCSSTTVGALKCKLESDISQVLQWFNVNGMKANPTKFQLISFGSYAVNLSNISVADLELNAQSCIKYLGVYIDSKLSFCNHVEFLCRKASRQINALMRLSNIIDYDTKFTMYKSFITANFEYCPLIWSLCNKTEMNKICRLQGRALRFVTSNFTLRSHELLQECKIVRFSDTIVNRIAIEMYKIMNNLVPSFICELFERQNNYSLRQGNSVALKLPRTTKYGKYSIVYVGAKIWNSLPSVFKEAVTLNDFKNFLSQWEQRDVWFYLSF
jgi:hypothetical protein